MTQQWVCPSQVCPSQVCPSQVCPSAGQRKGDMDNKSKKLVNKPLRFHTPGIRWRYSDGAVLEIGRDGAARIFGGRKRQSKKARKIARKQEGGK